MGAKNQMQLSFGNEATELSVLYIDREQPSVKLDLPAAVSLKSRTSFLLEELNEMKSKPENLLFIKSYSKMEISTSNSPRYADRIEYMQPLVHSEKLIFYGILTTVISIVIIGFLSFISLLLS